jgi:hypothetical protein
MYSMSSLGLSVWIGEIGKSQDLINRRYTDKKENIIFLRKLRGCKDMYDKRPPHIWGKICAFPHILGGPSSYMTLHPIPSKFPYI